MAAQVRLSWGAGGSPLRTASPPHRHHPKSCPQLLFSRPNQYSNLSSDPGPPRIVRPAELAAPAENWHHLATHFPLPSHPLGAPYEPCDRVPRSQIPHNFTAPTSPHAHGVAGTAGSRWPPLCAFQARQMATFSSDTPASLPPW